MWEGGLRVPAFISGPSVRPGAVYNELMHITGKLWPLKLFIYLFDSFWQHIFSRFASFILEIVKHRQIN